MATLAKPALLYRCQRCGRGLELGQIIAPCLGLVPVHCGHCHHQHLFSAHELQSARSEQFQNSAQSMGLLNYLRRIVHLQP